MTPCVELFLLWVCRGAQVTSRQQASRRSAGLVSALWPGMALFEFGMQNAESLRTPSLILLPWPMLLHAIVFSYSEISLMPIATPGDVGHPGVLRIANR